MIKFRVAPKKWIDKKLFITSLSMSILIAIHPQSALADCVYWAKEKTRFQVLDSTTIFLTGGVGGSILTKIFCCIYKTSELAVLKDSFCSYDSAVFYIDGEVYDVRDVKKVD